MPIQSLPQEVVEVVVKFLPSKKDQSSMSLVSTYFLSLARPILFSSVCLPKVLSDHAWYYDSHRTGSSSRDYKDFATFLTAAPALSLLIRQLTLRETFSSIGYVDCELGPLSMELLDLILSKLPSLRLLKLDSVMFETSDTLIPYRYHGIDRLSIHFPGHLGDIMNPLALFSHVRELKLSGFYLSGLQQPPEPIEQMLKTLDASNVLCDSLQVSDCEFWSLEAVARIFLRTAILGILRSFSADCNMRTEQCHVSPAVFDLLCRAAPTLASITFSMQYRQPFPQCIEQRGEQKDEEDRERSEERTEDIGGEVRGNEGDEGDEGDESIESKTRVEDSNEDSNEEIDEEIDDWVGGSLPSIVTPHDSSDDELPAIIESSNNNQHTYPKFDSHEMCTRLAPLTSLRSLTLKFHFYKFCYLDTLSACSAAFARMVPILASFPPCLRHITFSFTGPRLALWPNNVCLLAPLLPRFEQLESVVFEGAEGITIDENERVLNDLPEFRGLIRFRE